METTQTTQTTPIAAVTGTKPWIGKLFLLSIPMVIALGAWATLTAYKQARDTTFNDQYATVRDLVRNNATTVEGTVARITEALVGLAEASRAQPDMNAATFASLSDALMARYPAVQSLGLAQAATANSPTAPITEKNWLGDLVPAETRPGYVPLRLMRTAADSSTATKSVTATAITTANSTTTAAATPNNSNPLIGFDLSSSEPIDQALKQASKTGSALSYTALQKGLALLITRVRATGDGSDRYIISEINIAQLLSAGTQQTDADVQVLDMSALSGNFLLYTSLSQAKNLTLDRFTNLDEQRRLEQTTEVKVLDKVWGVNLRPLPNLFAQLENSGRNIAILGTVATFLSALLLYSLLSRNARVQQEVDVKTQELDGAYRKIREKEIVSMQTEKMSALGQMIAGVAHEINTPLGFVTSNVQTMQDDFDRYLTRLEDSAGVLGEVRQWAQMDNEQRKAWYKRALTQAETLNKGIERGQRPKNTELTGETIEGLDRISELVSSLKDFSRVDRAPVDDVDVHHCIERTLNIARNQIKTKANVVTRFGDLPHVRCNPSQINQVLLNLISNAAQAIPSFGEITITTAMQGADVCIEVEDNGAGMTDEVKNKVFEPFFTTKDVGKGTGLGLAISDRIIKDHGGKLWVDSQVGVGTKFSFTLPIQGYQAPANAESAA
jgi:signal transduction histidine kinase